MAVHPHRVFTGTCHPRLTRTHPRSTTRGSQKRGKTFLQITNNSTSSPRSLIRIVKLVKVCETINTDICHHQTLPALDFLLVIRLAFDASHMHSRMMCRMMLHGLLLQNSSSLQQHISIRSSCNPAQYFRPEHA